MSGEQLDHADDTCGAYGCNRVFSIQLTLGSDHLVEAGSHDHPKIYHFCLTKNAFGESSKGWGSNAPTT